MSICGLGSSTMIRGSSTVIRIGLIKSPFLEIDAIWGLAGFVTNLVPFSLNYKPPTGGLKY